MRRLWLIGLTVGLVIGIGTLELPFLLGLLGLIGFALLVLERPREAGAGGFLVGFGSAWILLLARVDLSCRTGCGGTDATGWYLLGTIALAAGIVLTARVARPAASRREGPPSTR